MTTAILHNPRSNNKIIDLPQSEYHVSQDISLLAMLMATVLALFGLAEFYAITSVTVSRLIAVELFLAIIHATAIDIVSSCFSFLQIYTA